MCLKSESLFNHLNSELGCGCLGGNSVMDDVPFCLPVDIGDPSTVICHLQSPVDNPNPGSDRNIASITLPTRPSLSQVAAKSVPNAEPSY